MVHFQILQVVLLWEVARSGAMASMACPAAQANGCARLTNAALPRTANKARNHVCMAPSLSSASSGFYSNSKRLQGTCSVSRPRKPSSARSVLETGKAAAEEAVNTVEEGLKTAPEAVKEGADALKEDVEGTVEAVKEVAQGKLSRTRSIHKPRGGNIKADPLRVIMFQVPRCSQHSHYTASAFRGVQNGMHNWI